MTVLVDVAPDKDGNLADLDKEIREAAAARRANGDNTDTGNNGDEPVLPAKLKGKSLAEIADMYQNLESEHGRMGNELGTLRTLADRLIDLKRAEDLGRAPVAKPKVEVTSAELLDKPTEALDRYTSSRESALESRLESRLTRVEQNVLAAQFSSRHPDAQQVARSTEFTQWVSQSRVRQRAAASAAAGDFMVADDLLTEFKDQQKRDREAAANAKNGSGKDANLEAARKASLETGASKAGAGDQRNEAGGPILSRSAIMRLMIEDRAKYESDEYQAEIQKAYAEGRVR